MQISKASELKEIIIRTPSNINFDNPQQLLQVINSLSQLKIQQISMLVLHEDDESGQKDLKGNILISGQPYYKNTKNINIPSINYDPIEIAISQAHQKNMKVNAWIPAFRDLLTRKDKQEWKLISSQQDKDSCKFLNPLLPQVHEYLLGRITEIMKYDFDEIRFDYFRFTNQSNQSTQREDALLEFLQKVSLKVNKNIGIYVFPPSETYWSSQNYEKLGKIAKIMPMSYWQDFLHLPKTDHNISNYLQKILETSLKHVKKQHFSPVISITHSITPAEGEESEVSQERFLQIMKLILNLLKKNEVQQYALFYWNDWRYMLSRLKKIKEIA